MTSSVAVVVPCFRSRDQIMGVVEAVPDSVGSIYLVDDACPEETGKWAAQQTSDPRVKLVALPENRGVGGATLAGFEAAFGDGCDVAVKVDSDGQIDPALAPVVAHAMAQDGAGYGKGSRFTTPKNLTGMPKHRVLLNAILSVTNKFASGYYSLSDPTNGLVGISSQAFDRIEPAEIEHRFFFESDLMHHLNLARVAGTQIPMAARYGDEESNLSFRSNVIKFMFGTIRNFFRRVFLRHFVLSFSVAGLYLLAGTVFSLFALIFGLYLWISGSRAGEVATAGSVAIVMLSAFVGLMFVTNFFVFDVNDEP